MRKNSILVFILGVLVITTHITAQAEGLILSAPPRETAEKGQKICGISMPNLSTLSILDFYRNPVRQPMIKGIKGGMGKVHKTLVGKKAGCHAAVLRTAFFKKKLKKAQRENLKTLVKSKAMPNQGISVSRRVSQKFKDKIVTELTIGKGASSMKGILKRFGGKAKSFIPAKAKEYDGYNMLLEGVIFGW